MLIAKDTTGDKFPKLPLPEAGTTQAVCCAIWDLGLQISMFKNEDGSDKYQHKIVIAWEIVEKINAPESEYHGKPYMLNKRYTLSLGDKANLRKDLESWRGIPFSELELQNGFDLEKLYGVNCLIGIKHEPDKKDPSIVYANITAILPTTKGTEKIVPVRQRDEAPPKWVLEKMEQAVPEPVEFEKAQPDIGDGEDTPF